MEVFGSQLICFSTAEFLYFRLPLRLPPPPLSLLSLNGFKRMTREEMEEEWRVHRYLFKTFFLS